MKITFLGATKTVTGSNFLVEAAGNEAGSMTGFMGMGMLNQGGAMFGANMSTQAQNTEPMNTMNVVGGGVETPVAEEPKVEETKPEGVACPNCGNMITANFCTECGTKKPEEPKEKFCTNCGEKADPNAKFCMNCGTKL